MISGVCVCVRVHHSFTLQVLVLYVFSPSPSSLSLSPCLSLSLSLHLDLVSRNCLSRSLVRSFLRAPVLCLSLCHSVFSVLFWQSRVPFSVFSFASSFLVTPNSFLLCSPGVSTFLVTPLCMYCVIFLLFVVGLSVHCASCSHLFIVKSSRLSFSSLVLVSFALVPSCACSGLFTSL